MLMISSELPEIVAVCDRAYVMRDKTIVGELARGDLTEENILRLAMHHGVSSSRQADAGRRGPRRSPALPTSSRSCASASRFSRRASPARRT